MAVITRFDRGQFEFTGADDPRIQPTSIERVFLGIQGAADGPDAAARVHAQVTPLDERLQPCGAVFLGEIERRAPDALAVWHVRPVRAPYLAVDLPMGAGHDRVVLRVTRCESFGLDYTIRGDVMGS